MTCDGRPDVCAYSMITDHYDLSNGMLNDHDYWMKTDSLVDANGLLQEVRIMQGSETGWKNHTSTVFTYDSLGHQTDCHERSWNGQNWEITRWIFSAYDSQGNMIQRSSYNNNGGIWNNEMREDWTYLSGAPRTKITSNGAGISWIPESKYQYSYASNLRTSLSVSTWDSIANDWSEVDVGNYQLLNNCWSARIFSIRQSFQNGIPLSQNYCDYDTLDRVVHRFEFLATVNASEQTASSTEEFYKDICGKLCPDRSYCIEQYFLSDTNWQPLINCCNHVYTYDLTGHLTTHTIDCGDGGEGNYTYQYDQHGNLIREGFHANNHSGEITHDYMAEYHYPDPAAITIVLAPQTISDAPCRGTIVRPLIGVTGGCDDKHYRWTPSTNLSSDTLLTPEILIDDSVTYTLTVTDGSGKTETATLIVGAVDQRPQIEHLSSCPEQVVLSAAYGQQPGNFTWYYNNTPVNTGSQLTVTHPGIYHVVNHYWLQPPFYQNSASCLSASLPITIGDLPEAVHSEQQAEICAGEEFELPDGTFQTESGFYPIHLQTTNGCDSTINVTLIVRAAPNPMISASSNRLQTDATGDYYVWYLNGQPIASGSTTSFILATQTGSYTVLVTDSNGCDGTSPGYFFAANGIKELREDPVILYPNPISDALNILFYDTPIATTAELFDVTGKCVLSKTLNDKANTFDLTNLSNGSYLVVIKSGQHVYRRTVSISH